MLTYAMTVLAANKQARLVGQRATFGRIEVAPNATNAIASRVTAWFDARGESDEALAALVAGDHPAGDAARRPGRHVARGHGRVGQRCGRLRPGPASDAWPGRSGARR